jgi:hypothetical protein
MGVKDDLFQKGTFVEGYGMRTEFCEDPWLGDTPLASQYPNLYNIVRTKEVKSIYFDHETIGGAHRLYFHL